MGKKKMILHKKPPTKHPEPPKSSAKAKTETSEAPADETVPTLPEGHVAIDILDDTGTPTRTSMPENEHGFRIHYDGAFWEHVSDHADGTWQFAKK